MPRGASWIDCHSMNGAQCWVSDRFACGRPPCEGCYSHIPTAPGATSSLGLASPSKLAGVPRLLWESVQAPGVVRGGGLSPLRIFLQWKGGEGIERGIRDPSPPSVSFPYKPPTEIVSRSFLRGLWPTKLCSERLPGERGEYWMLALPRFSSLRSCLEPSDCGYAMPSPNLVRRWDHDHDAPVQGSDFVDTDGSKFLATCYLRPSRCSPPLSRLTPTVKKMARSENRRSAARWGALVHPRDVRTSPRHPTVNRRW